MDNLNVPIILLSAEMIIYVTFANKGGKVISGPTKIVFKHLNGLLDKWMMAFLELSCIFLGRGELVILPLYPLLPHSRSDHEISLPLRPEKASESLSTPFSKLPFTTGQS